MHRSSLLAVVTLGSLWAGMLLVGGALLPSAAARAWPSMTLAAWLAAGTVIAAGEYVFLVVVADRMFPGASRRLVARSELGLGALMALLAVCAATAAMIEGGQRA